MLPHYDLAEYPSVYVSSPTVAISFPSAWRDVHPSHNAHTGEALLARGCCPLVFSFTRALLLPVHPHGAFPHPPHSLPSSSLTSWTQVSGAFCSLLTSEVPACSFLPWGLPGSRVSAIYPILLTVSLCPLLTHSVPQELQDGPYRTQNKQNSKVLGRLPIHHKPLSYYPTSLS